jgi:hypothetical protein
MPIMTYKLIAALALSLGLGTAALAQEQVPGVGAAGSGQAPTIPVWDQTINDAFFVDAGAGSLRTEEEIRANWGNLTAEQQATIRTDCDTMTTASVGTSTAGGSAQGAQLQAMTDLCGVIGEM